MEYTGYRYTHPNPLISLMLKPRPKDYRQRLWRRAVAQATEPTLTTKELMERIHAYEQSENGWQKRIHIQTPADSEGHPIVFFTTHPDSEVRINGIPANQQVYQNVTQWCMQTKTPAKSRYSASNEHLTETPAADTLEWSAYLNVEPHIYFNGDRISWQDLPALIRRHGAESLLEPVPVTIISNSSDVLEHLFGQDSENIREAKALISQGVYLENAAGEDPYDISDCF